MGSGCSGAAEAAAKLDGVSNVLCAQDEAYGHDLAEPVAALIVSLSDDYSHIVAPSTSASKNIMPRVAALLDVMIISEVTAVVDADTFERPIYAGNAIQTVKSVDAIKVATIRTSTFEASGEGGSASVTSIDAAANPGLSEWVEDKVATSDRPELTSAGIVVSGGRGVGSEGDFKKITDKAEVSHLEDRSLFILVDRNNHFGIFHASQMLNGAGNTDGNIEIRRYDFAGLAHLPIIWCIA